MPAERILVTDDEDAIREIVSSMLTSANFVCSQASSGKEALALLQSGEEYELMLSDLMMPGMDGEALLAATKERFPDMPVVMVTAVHDVSVALGPSATGLMITCSSPLSENNCWQPFGALLKTAV